MVRPRPGRRRGGAAAAEGGAAWGAGRRGYAAAERGRARGRPPGEEPRGDSGLAPRLRDGRDFQQRRAPRGTGQRGGKTRPPGDPRGASRGARLGRNSLSRDPVSRWPRARTGGSVGVGRWESGFWGSDGPRAFRRWPCARPGQTCAARGPVPPSPGGTRCFIPILRIGKWSPSRVSLGKGHSWCGNRGPEFCDLGRRFGPGAPQGTRGRWGSPSPGGVL